jgi:hypothetical protein
MPAPFGSTAKGNEAKGSTSGANAASAPAVPAPLGTHFRPGTATAQPPTVSAHVSAAQRRANNPLA